MERPRILWIDLARDPIACDAGLADTYSLEVRSALDGIDAAIDACAPRVLCCDFDLPDQVSLNALRTTKSRYPWLPVILLTLDHSVDLAVWALRLRVWDYFIKPVAVHSLRSSIDTLLRHCVTGRPARRHNLMPAPRVPTRSRPYRNRANGGGADYALDYVRQNCCGKLTLDAVAELCGMSKYHFSRTFKARHGLNFQDFVVRERVNHAKRLLRQPDRQITEIAFSVGFTDPSNFTRAFQRYEGMSPSAYRQSQL